MERFLIAGRRGAMRMREQDGVAEAAALADDHREPGRKRTGVGDVAGLDRPLEPARIGECAHRIRRREPSHQPIERGLKLFLGCVSDSSVVIASLAGNWAGPLPQSNSGVPEFDHR